MMVKPAVRGEPLTVPGPVGALEALLEGPKDPSRAVAVVCHPHPLHQGSMHNKVVHSLSRAFAAAGARVMRFNFRGVGESEGRYDEARGETDDAVAVARWMREQHPECPLWLGGFSFGAQVALQAAGELDPALLVTVAPPVPRFIENPPRRPACPWLLVQGEADEVVDPDTVIQWARSDSPRPELVTLPDTSHFFHRRLGELQSRVTEFLEAHSDREAI